MTGSNINNLRMLKRMSEEAWKRKNYFEAVRINKQLSEIEVDNPLWIVNCMGNSLLSADKEAGLKYYKISYSMLRKGRDKIILENGHFFYLMPWELQKLFIKALINAEFYEEAAVEVEKLICFYCEIGVFRSTLGSPLRAEEFLMDNGMPLAGEIEEISKSIRRSGNVVTDLMSTIESYHDNIRQRNTKIVRAIDQCHESRNYKPFLDGVDVDASLYVVDKRIDYRNVFFSEFPPLDNPDELYGGKGVYSPRAIMVYTSIEELLSSVPYGVPRKVKFRDLLNCLVGAYGEIIVNPASNNYLSIEKSILMSALN